MTPLSVVIITFNEEKNIGRCIESVRAVADDIVVIDSFSSDNTENICNSYGVRFIKHAFEGHIEQKNWAITQALYPHVLSLDADEALDSTLSESILKIKNNWTADGYSFNRLTNYCGKWVRHCGWYPDKKLRLWDSRKGHWGGINPHDMYIMHEDSKIAHLKGDLLHYSYYTITDHINQVNKFTDISSQALYKMGRKVSLAKVIISPMIKFIRDYFIKLGFLDGYTGFVISTISAHATFLKYAKLKSLNCKRN